MDLVCDVAGDTDAYTPCRGVLLLNVPDFDSTILTERKAQSWTVRCPRRGPKPTQSSKHHSDQIQPGCCGSSRSVFCIDPICQLDDLGSRLGELKQKHQKTGSDERA